MVFLNGNLSKIFAHLQSQGYHIPHKNLIKTKEQIDGIRKASQMTKDILDMLEGRIKAGVTTLQVNEWVHEYTIKHGAKPAPLNYLNFPKSCCTSPNNVICHGIPDKTVLKNGDIINVDVTTIVDGYFGDASRMYMIGEPSEQAKQLVKITKECLELGIEQVKPLNDLNNIGKVIEQHALKNGYSVVRNYCGHGVGLKFHEKPEVMHYRQKKKGTLLMPGMIFTIEPMINEGKYECVILNDGWTAVTKDGKLSAQWEHTVLVTENGVEILTL